MSQAKQVVQISGDAPRTPGAVKNSGCGEQLKRSRALLPVDPALICHPYQQRSPFTQNADAHAIGINECPAAEVASGGSVGVEWQCSGELPFSGCVARTSSPESSELTPSLSGLMSYRSHPAAS